MGPCDSCYTDAKEPCDSCSDSDDEMSPLKPPSVASTIPYCHRLAVIFIIKSTDIILTHVMLNKLILTFSQSDYLIKAVVINSHT